MIHQHLWHTKFCFHNFFHKKQTRLMLDWIECSSKTFHSKCDVEFYTWSVIRTQCMAPASDVVLNGGGGGACCFAAAISKIGFKYLLFDVYFSCNCWQKLTIYIRSNKCNICDFKLHNWTLLIVASSLNVCKNKVLKIKLRKKYTTVGFEFDKHFFK